ncbi:MAG: 50S ribosomal protein L2 [bacterium]|nr:50S ribosomal protein L2 [bacterium]
MANRLLKPTSAGRRGMTARDFSMVTDNTRIKSLTASKKEQAGRNTQGHLTVRHRGGGAKRLFRTIDFKRNLEGQQQVKAIQYDPNRTARVALLENKQGENSFILATTTMKVGDTISHGPTAEIKDGNTLPLQNIPVGLTVHNIEGQPGQGGKYARAAGTYAILQGLDNGYATVKLMSGTIMKISDRCLATLGQTSNIHNASVVIGKAGRNRNLGKRPTVRGKAMHPAAHPHGGGEGNNGIGLRKGPKTKWGAQALGVKTSKRNRKKKLK